MPYQSITELPDAVRSRYSERCQEVFRKAFNANSDKSEESRFKIAHTAAGMCKDAGKAEWDTAYINDLPDSAFACIDAGGEKDDEGKTVPRSLRHYPHHKADGSLDLPHLRNALARVAQTDTAECGEGHLKSHANAQGVGKAMMPLKATVIDDDAFRLLAFPFSGPIPSARWPRGVDLDEETFTPRTDIKKDWFKERVTDWHHGNDPLLRRSILGKAVDLGRFDGASDEPDADGWWVTVWLDHGQRRLNLIKKLAEQGAQIYGSSESLPNMVKKSSTGEILVWPYLRQTLSTSPQNTHSVLRPLKAVLDGTVPTAAFWSDIAGSLADLGTDLRSTSLGEDVAKAGRMLRSANHQDMLTAIDELAAALERLQGVVSAKFNDHSAGRDPAST